MRSLSLFGVLVLLAGCGAVYHSPTIREGVVDGAKVRVIALTPETVLVANREPYSPQTLPAAFRSTAGTWGSSPGGAGALPDSPNLPESRPVSLEVRLPPTPADEPYRIGVGDVVLLATKTGGDSVAELSGLLAAENRRQGYTVQDDGSIAIPDVGRVRIAGLTLEEAEAVVFQRLLERQIDPSFSLEVAEFNARKVSIGGAVVNPGVAPITLTPLTLDAAIAAAGGVAVADQATAVIRIYRDGTLYEVPVDAFLNTPAHQKIRLIDGDSVFVDTEYDLEKAQAYFQEQIRLVEVRQGARSSAMSILTQEVALRRAELAEQRSVFTDRLELGAEQRKYVYITGEVKAPGSWPLPYEQRASLAEALFSGGGVAARTGNPGQIYVLRGSPDPRDFGGVTALHLDATTATGMMLATRLELRPDDVIFVAEQPVTRWNRVIDQISPSLIAIPVREAVQN